MSIPKKVQRAKIFRCFLDYILYILKCWLSKSTPNCLYHYLFSITWLSCFNSYSAFFPSWNDVLSKLECWMQLHLRKLLHLKETRTFSFLLFLLPIVLSLNYSFCINNYCMHLIIEKGQLIFPTQGYNHKSSLIWWCNQLVSYPGYHFRQWKT